MPSKVITYSVTSNSHRLPYEKGWSGDSTISLIERDLPQLPVGWSWTRLRSIASVEAGKTPSKDSFVDDGIPYFKMYNLRNQKIDFEFQSQYIKPEVHFGQLAKSRIHPGDLIMNIVGPPLGKLAIVPESFPEANTNQAAVVIRSYANRIPGIWLFYYLSEMSEIDSVSTRGSAGQVNISVNQSRDLLIPIPPLAEQRRIVEALDKYLALVDEIEQAQIDLDVLFAQLKSKVLDMAIRGELTAQDPSDEPASELLERIHTEKVAMVERGELKPKDIKGDTVIFTGSDGLRYEKPADGSGEARCIESEIPFELSNGWSWVRLGNLVKTISGTSYKKDDVSNNGVRIIRGGNIEVPRIALKEDDVYLPDSYADEEKVIHKNDVVIVASTGSSTAIGRPAIAIETFNRVQIGAFLRIIRAYSISISSWIHQVFKTDYYLSSIRKLSKGTNINNVKEAYITNLLIPIPPLEEQARITSVLSDFHYLI